MANFELDYRDREIILRMNELTGEAIRLWYGLLKKSPATTAIGALFVRVSASWKSICMILLNCEDANEMRLCSNDVAALVRCMHDVCVQAEYIAAGDPTEGLSADELGQLYLDFEHIERHRMAEKAVMLKSGVAKTIASSPHRPAGEARNQREYDRVKSKYPDKRHWYRGTFVELAKKVDREEDEFWFTKLLHSSIHGGPISVVRGATIQGSVSLMVALQIMQRALQLVVKRDGIRLSDRSAEMMMKPIEVDLLDVGHDLKSTAT